MLNACMIDGFGWFNEADYRRSWLFCEFLFGSEARSIDATMWAFLACLRGFPVETSASAHLAARKNLVAYIDRIRARHWRDAGGGKA